MEDLKISKDDLDLLDDLVDMWFDVATERKMAFPVTFAVIGHHGQYVCGMMRDGPKKQTFCIVAANDSDSLFEEPPHHTLLIDNTGRTTLLTASTFTSGPPGSRPFTVH